MTERDGQLRRVEADGTLAAAAVAMVPVTESGEGGLLGIALHPDFATNRALFLYYTSDEGGLHNRVEQWILSEDGASAVADRVIVGDIPAGLYHNGGRLRIGPDGHLWVTTGDARVPSSSQDPTSLAGAILRVDTDGNVPADNPDPNSPIVVSGVRNSQGIDWLPDGRLIITDHGPSGDTGRFGHDEINVAEVGANLGWPDLYSCEEEAGFHPPSMTWRDALPPGGHARYTGTEIPEWSGDVLIGVMGFDSPSQPHLHRISLDEDGNVTTSETYPGAYGRLREVVRAPMAGVVTTSNCEGAAPAATATRSSASGGPPAGLSTGPDLPGWPALKVRRLQEKSSLSRTRWDAALSGWTSATRASIPSRVRRSRTARAALRSPGRTAAARQVAELPAGRRRRRTRRAAPPGR